MTKLILMISVLSLPILANAAKDASSCEELGGGMITVQACNVVEDSQASAPLAQLPQAVQICANGDYIAVISTSFDGGFSSDHEDSLTALDGSALLIAGNLQINLPSIAKGATFETSISNPKMHAQYFCRQLN